jgi:chemotaxis protein MotC
MIDAPRFLACATLMLGLVVPALSEEQVREGGRAGGLQPFEIMRSIQVVQDQMVQGSRSAQGKLPKLIARAGEQFLRADPEAWRDRKNARAAIIYTLSGGPARVARAIAKLNKCSEPERTLLEGALAYVDGSEARAREILLPIDAKSLPPFVGGHVAIAQSILAKGEPRKAIAFLDQARLLAPGTLIEETSLRREVLFAEDAGDLEKFANLSSQYLRRFSRSVYAENFRRRFAASILRLGVSDEKIPLEIVADAVNALEPTERLALYLRIARAAVIAGKLEPARFAAERAVGLAQEGTVEAGRARLYGAAALALTEDPEAGLGTLEGLDPALLPKDDADLRQAVIVLARHIRAGAGSAPLPGGSIDATPPARAASTDLAAAGLLSRAEKVIRAATERLDENDLP